VPPRTRVHSLVVETRSIQHPVRDRAQTAPPDPRRRVPQRRRRHMVTDPGGSGTAIVRVARACPQCAQREGQKAEKPDAPGGPGAR